jgi:pimeloyl-ACP methyl ester carboxylesterase
VRVNGVRLQYLDWGGSGAGLVFIHGLGDSPHAFDDIAPQFTGHHHVIAYARRAHGRSEVKGPYDPATLVEDLRQLLDSAGIGRVVLAGWSLGGDELSGFAERYPDRVAGLVYLECYDYGDSSFARLLQHWPLNFTPGPADLASRSAFRTWWKRVSSPNAPLSPSMDAEIADLTVRRPDGSVRVVTSDSLSNLFFAGAMTYRAPFSAFHMPVLGIWGRWNTRGVIPDSAPDSLRRRVDDFMRDYGRPFQDSTLARMRAAMPQARLVMLDSAAHAIFPFQNHDTIIAELRRFLGSPANQPVLAPHPRGAARS